jgi:TRAP-type C4-dicarboxylate transport system substrate-binding protein
MAVILDSTYLEFKKAILVYKKIDLKYIICLSCQHPGIYRIGFLWEEIMKSMLKTAVAALALTSVSTLAHATELRLSHQWSNKDIRHQVAQIVADEVGAAGVDLDIKIFGSKSLFKPREQYKPLSRGQLDMTVLPLSYAGGQQPAYNLTLMPGLVKNHDHAARLSDSPFMAALEEKMAEDDVMVLVHGYLAGGFAGKDKCITKPEDVVGLQTRAAGKSFEQMLAGSGASIASMASSEIYNAMQTGVLQAANTSSSSFVSYRIYEQVSCYTPAGDVALWFMYQPLLMNKTAFEGLNDAQQAALLAASEKAEAFYLKEAKLQDAASAKVFADAGVEIAEMSAEDFEAWRAIAMETSYAKFVADVTDGQKLLDLALAVD